MNFNAMDNYIYHIDGYNVNWSTPAGEHDELLGTYFMPETNIEVGMNADYCGDENDLLVKLQQHLKSSIMKNNPIISTKPAATSSVKKINNHTTKKKQKRNHATTTATHHINKTKHANKVHSKQFG